MMMQVHPVTLPPQSHVSIAHDPAVKGRNRRPCHPAKRRILVLFGTRPEIIKLAPVVEALDQHGDFETLPVSSSQHKDLLRPLIQLFHVQVAKDLRVMRPGQSPNQLCAKILHRLDSILQADRPDAVLVQGDTTTALAGAMASFHHRIPVGHVEAGLRTDDSRSPFPEEMNRRLISRLATWHFAATERNRQTLLAEGVAGERVFVTGNPVIDALRRMRAQPILSPLVARLLKNNARQKLLVLTTHRRESFGPVMAENLRTLRDFTVRHADVTLVFPVHPNPVVQKITHAILARQPRIELIAPLDYLDFIGLMSRAWLIVSDSGGIQEEAPSLGKPLLVLRTNTERPEAVEAGMARLVGGQPGLLAALLEECHAGAPWMTAANEKPNPFGQGDAGPRIARALARSLAVAAEAMA